MKYYKCIVCHVTPITKFQYLNANGCCSQYCNYVYSGIPMPYDHSLGIQILIEKTPKNF